MISYLNEEKANSLFEEGNQLFEQKRFDEAEKLYNEALVLFPNSVDILYNLALIYFEQQKYNLVCKIVTKLKGVDCEELIIELKKKGVDCSTKSDKRSKPITDGVQSFESDSQTNDSISSSLPEINKVVNVTLTGGIIGLLGGSPHGRLNKIIKRENQNGWKVIQIIPSDQGNLFIGMLRFIVLIITLFFYTTASGYYIIMEKSK
jgi:hypothetical protein